MLKTLFSPLPEPCFFMHGAFIAECALYKSKKDAVMGKAQQNTGKFPSTCGCQSKDEGIKCGKWKIGSRSEPWVTERHRAPVLHASSSRKHFTDCLKAIILEDGNPFVFQQNVRIFILLCHDVKGFNDFFFQQSVVLGNETQRTAYASTWTTALSFEDSLKTS